MIKTNRLERLRDRGKALVQQPWAKKSLELGAWALGGWALSAGALAGQMMPLGMGLALGGGAGWQAVAAGIGAMVGYPMFWGKRGYLGSLWSLAALGVGAWLGKSGTARRQKGLIPAFAALILAGAGILWRDGLGQRLGVETYLGQAAVGILAAWICQARWKEDAPWAGFGMEVLGVLSLAQIRPMRYLGLGFVAAGWLGTRGSWIQKGLAGIALDAAGVTKVPMTVVMGLSAALGRLPGMSRWVILLSAGIAYLPGAIMAGVWDVRPLPGLILGGAAAGLFPGDRTEKKPRRSPGEGAVAQVRLEKMALALEQMGRSLEDGIETAPDEGAVLEKWAKDACGQCPERRGCKARDLVSEPEHPGCRKPGRMASAQNRGREELRRARGEQRRREEYRLAVKQQYEVLAEVMERLADELADQNPRTKARYRPEIGLSTRGRELANGDQCIWFEGMGNRYYVLLCDGMGTGTGARAESGAGCRLVKAMIQAGAGPEQAMGSVNSLAVLRNLGGCTTMDLAELDLETGKGTLYKWGAGPSYVMSGGQLKKIGTAGPPPGLWQHSRETAQGLSLNRGQTLILLSDGAGEEGLLDSARTTPTQPAGEMAAAILEKACSEGDDATAVVIRLERMGRPTQEDPRRMAIG